MELLVVVLIIGILAAVALPQYKIAVAKARVSTMLSLASKLAQAEEVYYLNNSQYSGSPNILDTTLPQGCSPSSDDASSFQCNSYMQLYLDTLGSVNINYCPNATTSAECLNNRDFQIAFRLQHFNNTSPQRGKRMCFVYNNSKLGKTICSTLAGFVCNNC